VLAEIAEVNIKVVAIATPANAIPAATPTIPSFSTAAAIIFTTNKEDSAAFSAQIVLILFLSSFSPDSAAKFYATVTAVLAALIAVPT
jgi:hypothetical protein